MHFSHSPELWSDFPELVAGVLHAEGLHPHADVETAVQGFNAMAQARLAQVAAESELPEIQAWRRAFSRLGLKPTQYRCASESLLRRFKKEGALPRIHPLIDLCNAASLAFAIPVAVFDLDAVAGWLQVRRATGEESYLGFAGETEQPEPGEVVFADADNRAHARRWTHRQSGLSAVRNATARVLIVAEGLHAGAGADVPRLLAALSDALQAGWQVVPATRVLTAGTPRLDIA